MTNGFRVQAGGTLPKGSHMIILGHIPFRIVKLRFCELEAYKTCFWLLDTFQLFSQDPVISLSLSHVPACVPNIQ